MGNYIKKKTDLFIRSYSLQTVNYLSLVQTAEKLGYTVIEYNSYANNEDVETVIRNLRLEKTIMVSRGFTYSDNDYRLIFINTDLNEREKTLVISHEIGHIVLGHVNSQSVIGKDVVDEHEASEFAHYLLNQGILNRLYRFFSKNKKKIIILVIVLAAAAAATGVICTVRKEQSYYGDYYVSSTGNKYHKKDCIYVKDKSTARRLTKEEYESGAYEPCNMCLPDK